MPTLSKEVEEAFRTLPARYLGADPGFDATYQVRLGDVGHTWEIRCTPLGARVRMGATRRAPDVVIGSDARTWLRLRQGELSGIEAFSQRRLYARGELDLALGFEGLFRLPNGRPPLLRIHDVAVGRLKVSTLTMGEGPEDVLLLHGLGGTKSSFFDTAAALSRRYRVHAMDFPGFGGSPKPPLAPYDAAFFARTVVGAMDAMGIDRAHVVGNSMGVRPARLAPAGARPAARAGDAAPLVRAPEDRGAVLVHVRRPRPRGPERGRYRRRRVRAHLPQRGRPAGLPHL